MCYTLFDLEFKLSSYFWWSRSEHNFPGIDKYTDYFHNGIKEILLFEESSYIRSCENGTIKLTTSNDTYDSIQYNIHISQTQSIKGVIGSVDRRTMIKDVII